MVMEDESDPVEPVEPADSVNTAKMPLHLPELDGGDLPPSKGIILFLCHFCEVHGPTCVMCTQSLPNFSSDDYGTGSKAGTCLSCRLVLPKEYTDRDVRFIKTTSDHSTYVSSQYPNSPDRYKAVRQACLRSLSSEHTFNDHTPMIFSDSTIGTAIVLTFTIGDGSSRGQVRRYALVCLGESETQVVSGWNIVVPRMEQMVKSIKLRALIEADKEESKKFGPERYLRTRDFNQSSKSLTTILKDDKLFLEIHSELTAILSIIDRS